MAISGLLITKNNANSLKWALQSVRSYLDELVIVDDFSTDHTLEIAESYQRLLQNTLKSYPQKHVSRVDQRIPPARRRNSN